MTMLTPPGQGARRRTRGHGARQVAAALVAALVVVAASVAVWRFSIARETPPPVACPPATVTVPAPISPAAAGEVTVNVLNATRRAGLAADVAGQLAARGFRIATIGNDTSPRPPSAPALIRYGPHGRTAALALARQIPQVAFADDGRPGGRVDLVLAEGWTRLRPPAVAATAQVALPTPTPTPITPTPTATSPPAPSGPSPHGSAPCTPSTTVTVTR